MIKYVVNGTDSTRVIGLGLSEGNIEKLKDGKPILVEGADIGFPLLTILVHYGETEQALIDEMRASGMQVDDVIGKAGE